MKKSLSTYFLKLLLKISALLCVTIFAISVFYFSWVTDGSFKTESVIPNWLLEWSNNNPNLRTAVPFLPIGLLMPFLFSKKKATLLTVFLSFIIVSMAELGQFIIPTRVPDHRDVLYGLLGTGIGLIHYNLLLKTRWFK